MPKTEQPRYFASIEALRGWAAMYIVVLHLSRVTVPPVPVPGILSSFLMLGYSGVTLFFIISAFTLTLSMQNRTGEHYAYISFCLRRFFRIAPLFYFWMAVLVQSGWVSWKQFGVNIAFLFNFFPSTQQGIVWASWTLGVEMVFYVLFPLIYRYFGSLKKAVLLYVITQIMAWLFKTMVTFSDLNPAAQGEYFYFSIFHHLPTFALGMVCFFLHQQFGESARYHKLAPYSILGFCAVFGLILTGNQPPLADSIFWFGLAYAMLVLGLLTFPLGIVVNRFACFMGRISYSLYLDHTFLLLKLSLVFVAINAFDLPLLVRFLICCVLAFVVVTVCAWLTYTFIEKPGMKLGSLLIRRFRPQAAPSAPAVRPFS